MQIIDYILTILSAVFYGWYAIDTGEKKLYNRSIINY